MAFTTLFGFGVAGTTDGVGANGLIQLGTNPYKSPTAAHWNGMLGDYLALLRKTFLSGIVAGGVCTVSTLTVTIPIGTAFVAGGQFWVSPTITTVIVANVAITYVWACSDGQMRQTTDTTPPTGFDDNRSFVLLIANAGAGTATLNLSVQERARTIYQSARFVSQNSPGIAPTADLIPGVGIVVVPAGSQLIIMDSMTCHGTLTVHGKMRII